VKQNYNVLKPFTSSGVLDAGKLRGINNTLNNKLKAGISNKLIEAR
jgi:hypothetical protein